MFFFFSVFAENPQKMDEPASTSENRRRIGDRDGVIPTDTKADKLGGISTFFDCFRLADSVAGKFVFFLIYLLNGRLRFKNIPKLICMSTVVVINESATYACMIVCVSLLHGRGVIGDA